MYDYDIGINNPSKRKHGSDDILLGIDSKGRNYYVSNEELEGHMLVLGKTGTGKSTLLLRIINQLDSMDCNIIVLDPHGELTAKSTAICRNKELLYFGGQSVERAGPVKHIMSNFLKCSNTEDDLERTSEWVRSIFSQDPAISSGTWGPRIQVIFSSVLKEYMRQNGSRATISGFLGTLVSKDRLDNLSSSCTDENLRNILGFQVKNWAKWLEYAGSSINKLLSILSNRQIRYLVSSEKESFDLGLELSRSNRLVASGISKVTNSEETSRVFSLLLLMRIWNETTGQHAAKQTYIVIDEAQNVPESILEVMLSEGRKFGIHLILSTQFLNSRDEFFEKYLLGNVRSFACFQLSPSDAFRMGNMFHGRLMNLVISVLKEQSYHRFLHWSGGNISSLLPSTVVTVPLKLQGIDDTIRTRIDNSISRYGEFHDEGDVPGSVVRKSLHSIILEKFESYLDAQNIHMRRESAHGKSIHDGYFAHDGREYAVECEVSDMSNRFRVLDKVRNIGGKVLVFLVPEVDRQKLIEYIANPTSFTRENGIISEKPLRNNDRTLHASEVWSKLDQIIIVSYDGREFHVMGKTKIVKFSAGRLSSQWASALFSISTGYSEIRKRIYSFMREKGKYIMARGNSDLASFVGSEISWKSVTVNTSETLSCGDIIMAP